MRAAIRFVMTFAVLAGCVVGLHQWLQEYQKPTVREAISEPLFTVETPSYAKALNEGKQVIQFGPLPGSAFYAGGLAFKQPEEALVWLKETGKFDKGWRVFQLSGDFSLDTHLIRGLPYTNKTLVVSREVPMD